MRRNQLGICITRKPVDTWWFFIMARCQAVRKKSADPGEPTKPALPLTTAELNKRNEKDMDESHKKALREELDQAAKSVSKIRKQAFHASPKKAAKGRGRGKGKGKGGASSAATSKPKAKAKGKAKVSKPKSKTTKRKAKEMNDEQEEEEEEETTKDEEQEEPESEVEDVPNTAEEEEEARVSLSVSCRLATVYQNLNNPENRNLTTHRKNLLQRRTAGVQWFQLSYFVWLMVFNDHLL